MSTSDMNNSTTTTATSKSRRTPRRSFLRPVGILCRGEFALYNGYQLSENGLLFGSQNVIPVHEQAIVSILIPGEGVAVLRGKIIYVRQETHEDGRLQHGVGFRDVPIHYRRKIRNFVAAKTQSEAEAENTP